MNTEIPTPRTDSEFRPIQHKFLTPFESGFNEGISERCSPVANPYIKDESLSFMGTEHRAWNNGFEFGKGKRERFTQLERELTIALAERDELKEQLEHALNPVHSCSENCQRPACVMRRQLDEWRECFEPFICNSTNSEHKWIGNVCSECGAAWECVTRHFIENFITLQKKYPK